jgi:ATP-dependent Clp protease ATP-binding subunit ClpC
MISIYYRNRIEKLYARLTELGYKLTLSDKAKAFIAEKVLMLGARPLKRAIQNTLKTHLPKRLLL